MKRYFINCFFQHGASVLRRQLLYKILFFIFFSTGIKNSFAWVYPEHRQIAILAIQRLSTEHRFQLDRFWAEARVGFEGRLTELVIDTTQGIKPRQLDFASWTAISGDHSCSPENLLYNVLHTEWILNVADIAARLSIDIADDKTRTQRINAVRHSDIRFARADDEYATRASSSNAHFLLSRPQINTELAAYLTACLKEGTELNALGIYIWFHNSALLKAARYATEHLNPNEKSALMLTILAEEAFALHFLQDAYSAGHIAGSWGNNSLRKGTHDYYNEHGLEVVSWNGTRTVNMGDAYMTNDNADAAAVTARMSLEQLLDAAAGKLVLNRKAGAADLTGLPDSFNVCKKNRMPLQQYDPALFEAILEKTPVPGLATGFGEVPRFRAEIGTFLGISASLDGSGLFGAFGKEQTDFGTQGGLEGNIRFGFGLEGILNQSSDGLVFVQVGWRYDAPSTNKFINSDPAIANYSIASAIPGRAAYNLRLRIPFWVIPGDLVLAAPILLLTSPKTLKEMAVTAANGGLLGWQSGIATRAGRFQFVLGREVGLSFYGLGSTKDVIIIPGAVNSSLLQYKSTKMDFPIVEYRPLRNFSLNESSSLIVQLNGGVDLPHNVKLIAPEGETVPQLKRYWYLGLRITFNWRHYY